LDGGLRRRRRSGHTFSGGGDVAVSGWRGIWGITQPVGLGFAIINFVWWIGIGHAGTLISAILLLFKQSWRNLHQ